MGTSQHASEFTAAYEEEEGVKQVVAAAKETAHVSQAKVDAVIASALVRIQEAANIQNSPLAMALAARRKADEAEAEAAGLEAEVEAASQKASPVSLAGKSSEEEPVVDPVAQEHLASVFGHAKQVATEARKKGIAAEEAALAERSKVHAERMEKIEANFRNGEDML